MKVKVYHFWFCTTTLLTNPSPQPLRICNSITLVSSNSSRQLNCCQAICPSQPQPFCSHWIMLFYLSLSFLLAFLPSHVMSLSSWCCLSSSSLTMVCFLVTSWRVTFLRHHLGVWVDLVWAPYPVTDWLYSYLSRVDHGPDHVDPFNLKD